MPPMETLPAVWTLADALARRCDVAAVGTVRHEALAPVTPGDVQAMALQLAPHALLALLDTARAGGRPGVEAARLLLAIAHTTVMPDASTIPDVPDWALRNERVQ